MAPRRIRGAQAPPRSRSLPVSKPELKAQGGFGEAPKPAREARALPRGIIVAYFFFLGEAVGEGAAWLVAGAADAAGAGAAALDPPWSTLKVQCVSTFLPPDFALTITVQVLSFSRCVT